MENLINPTKIKFNKSIVELRCDVENKLLNKRELAENFTLDVKTKVNDVNGLEIVQGDKIVKRSFEICSSTRKKNKLQTYIPTGFTKVILPLNNNTVEYSNPPEIIPKGCWCTHCQQIGPYGHSLTCNKPTYKSLNLTLKGFIECFYGNKKTREKINGITNEGMKKSIDSYIYNVEKIEEQDEIGNVEQIFILSMDELSEKSKNILFSQISHKIDKILTNITYKTVQNIKGSDGFFPGCLSIQYYTNLDKKVSIRVYEEGKIVIVSYPRNKNKQHFYEKVINKINETGQEIKFKEIQVSVSNSSFRMFKTQDNLSLELKDIYNYFHPKDEKGDPIDNKGPKKTIYTERINQSGESEIISKSYITMGKTLYRYTVGEPDRGKMSLSLNKCTRDSQFMTCSPYKITAQIYVTGLIQLVFSYSDDKFKFTNIENLEKQFETIEKLFNEIKKVLTHHFKEIQKYNENFLKEVETKKTSNLIFNTVPGVIPYSKKKIFNLGNIVEFFDEEEGKWSDKYGVIVFRKKDKQTNNYTYKIIEGLPYDEKINKEFRNLKKNSTSLPNISKNGKEIYILENYKGKKIYKVISGKPEKVLQDNLRIYKQTVNGPLYQGGTQVAPRTQDGIPSQPIPYSFYGKCQGGKTQYIDLKGERSRKDNKYYPVCKNVNPKDEEAIKEQQIDLILNGIDEKDANIKIGIVHGVTIEDKYAGTFIPGTTDIGNIITFWNGDEWIEGTIEEAKKVQLGNDLNHSYWVVKTDEEEGGEEDDEENEEEYVEYDYEIGTRKIGKNLYHVIGDDFHPKHRESRKFDGLNKIKSEEKRKQILIDCAKKLNLIKPEIDLEKENTKIQKKILDSIEKITNKRVFYELINNTTQLSNKNIENFGEIPYVAALIPMGTIRTLLFIENDKNQYLINDQNMIMKININAPSGLSNTILDGFIMETKNSLKYLPIDLLYQNGEKITTDYLDNGVGSLFKLNEIVSEIIFKNDRNPKNIKIEKPLGSFIGKGEYIGPILKEQTIVNFVKENIKPKHNIYFIPQKGKTDYLLWKPHKKIEPVVVQIIDNKGDDLYLGMSKKAKGGGIRYIKLFKYPLDKNNVKDKNGKTFNEISKGDFVQFSINFMENGNVNKEYPYLHPTIVSKKEALTFEETTKKLLFQLSNFPKSIFDDNEKWKFESTEKTYVPTKSSREPLVLLDINEFL